MTFGLSSCRYRHAKTATLPDLEGRHLLGLRQTVDHPLGDLQVGRDFLDCENCVCVSLLWKCDDYFCESGQDSAELANRKQKVTEIVRIVWGLWIIRRAKRERQALCPFTLRACRRSLRRHSPQDRPSEID